MTSFALLRDVGTFLIRYEMRLQLVAGRDFQGVPSPPSPLERSEAKKSRHKFLTVSQRVECGELFQPPGRYILAKCGCRGYEDVRKPPILRLQLSLHLLFSSMLSRVLNISRAVQLVCGEHEDAMITNLADHAAGSQARDGCSAPDKSIMSSKGSYQVERSPFAFVFDVSWI